MVVYSALIFRFFRETVKTIALGQDPPCKKTSGLIIYLRHSYKKNGVLVVQPPFHQEGTLRKKDLNFSVPFY